MREKNEYLVNLSVMGSLDGRLMARNLRTNFSVGLGKKVKEGETVQINMGHRVRDVYVQEVRLDDNPKRSVNLIALVTDEDLSTYGNENKEMAFKVIVNKYRASLRDMECKGIMSSMLPDE